MEEEQSHTAAACLSALLFTSAELDDWSLREALSNKAKTLLSPPHQAAVNHRILSDMWLNARQTTE